MPPTHPTQADVAAAYRTLIAHETEPKERDFYRTRLQRLEQATEPECEFDWRSQVAAAGVGVYCPLCSAKCADTDLPTQLAKAIRAAWVDRLDWDELAHAALKFLTSAGRFIPAGGMALTAEQVEDVRTVLNKFGFNQVTPEVVQAIEASKRLTRALFPATEPAEDPVGDPLQAWKGFLKPKPIGWYRTMELDFAAKHFGFPVKPDSGDWFTASDGGKWCSESNEWELRYYPPAPAEPAEEETKADGLRKCRKKPVEVEAMQYDGKDWRSIAQWIAAHGAPMGRTASGLLRIHTLEGEMTAGSGDWIIRGVAGEFYPCKPDIFAQTYDPASSPVVPAPTETDWQTWEAVPDDVWFTSTSAVGSLPAHRKRGSLVDWQFRDGSVGVYDVSQTWNAKLMARAPFVAAEEG